MLKKTQKSAKMREVMDAIEAVCFFTALVLLAWLYCAATPDQMSGESDWTTEDFREVQLAR